MISEISNSTVGSLFRLTKHDLHEIAQKAMEKAIKKAKALLEYIFT